MAKTPIQIRDLSDTLSVGTQSFVDQSSLISVPFTTIVGRAQIPNIASDLKPSFGIERIMCQQHYQIQNEFGPNGEIIWGTPNDTNGLIRFCGDWRLGADSGGEGLIPFGSTDFTEITFYGTGLNILTIPMTNATQTWNVFVDGTLTQSNVFNTQQSSIIGARNYASNNITNLASGLGLGLHTIRLQHAASDTALRLYGFEVLNTNSTTLINVNPGTSYISGSKLASQTVQTSSYNSSFTNTLGTPGAKGGHVLVYLDSNASLKKDIQYTDVTQNNLSSATHSNEEMVRQYAFREFGAGRSDDFSLLTTSSNRAFALDDDTTNLTVISGASTINNGIDSLATTIGGAFVSFTFVGTGLDIKLSTTAVTGVCTIIIDGVTLGTLAPSQNVAKTYKLVSGLPYGTHVLRIDNTSLGGPSSGFGLVSATVYQPKKPTLPSGAIELADYNLMATYVVNSSATDTAIATGIIRKHGAREFNYVGTWAYALNSAQIGGMGFGSNTNGDSVSYTFYGTGFEARLNGTGGSAWVATVSVDSSTNLTGFTTSAYGTGVTLTASTGVLTTTGSTPDNVGIAVTNMTLGLHTVKFTRGVGGNNMQVLALDIVTPIHSVKSNMYVDLQNTLPIGSCAMSDNRQITPIKNQLPSAKAWAQAVGITTGPTTTSTSFVPMTDMSVVIKMSQNGRAEINYSARVTNNTASNYTTVTIFIDGAVASLTNSAHREASAGNVEGQSSGTFIAPLSAGVHKVDLYWRADNGGTSASNGTDRVLTVKEL